MGQDKNINSEEHTESSGTAEKYTEPAANTNTDTASDSNEISIPEITIEGIIPADIKLRIFIPSRAVQLPPLPLLGDYGFAGDNRSFDYENGTSRAEIWVDAFFNPEPDNIISVKELKFGQSEKYNASSLVEVGGKPWWWKAVRTNPFLNTEELPYETATAVVNYDTLSVTGTFDSLNPTQCLKVTFHINGTNPLEANAPAINGDIDLNLYYSGEAVNYQITGRHDPFPCWELYLNRQLIYNYDASNSNPFELFPMQQQLIKTEWIILNK